MRTIFTITLLLVLCGCGQDSADLTFRKLVATDELLQKIPLAEDAGIVSQVYEPWIKGVSFPYNGGLVRLDNEWVLAFRENIADPKSHYGFQTRIGIVRLDDAFTPKGLPDFLEDEPTFTEDPRLIKVKNELFIVANAADAAEVSIRNMTLIGLNKTELGFGKLKPKFVTTLSTGQTEKNWSPFIYNDSLHFSYNLSPFHDVRRLDDLTKPESFVPVTDGSNSKVTWDYGRIRGGTPAIKIDDKSGYLGFFHSIYKSSSGRVVYFIGAYTFGPEAPFQMTSISEHPILFRGLYDSRRSDVGGTDWFVAFPTGLEIVGDSVFVSLGVNDATLKIVELDLPKLMRSLRPVTEPSLH